MPATRRTGRTGLQSTLIEAGNGPLADAEREATTFETRALYGAKDSTNCRFTNQVWCAPWGKSRCVVSLITCRVFPVLPNRPRRPNRSMP